MRYLIAMVLALVLSGPVAAVEIGDDGLHKPEWLRDTFKDLQEDFAEAKAEKDAPRKWRVLFTPTMIFSPAEPDQSKSIGEQAVAVMPGAFGPGTTLGMLTWVAEDRYLDQSEEDFQRYHARMIRERNDGDGG